MATKTITIIGSLNTDLVTTTPRVPSGGETLTAQSFSTGSGGKGANQAVACARLSRSNPASSSGSMTSGAATEVQIRMVGAVGDDLFGTNLISGLKADFIDTAGIKIVEGESTGVAVILLESSTGENRILVTPGANHSLQASEYTAASSLGSPPPSLIILQLEIKISTVFQILKTAKLAGIPCLLNPAPAVELPDEAFEGLEHLILNESEAAILSHQDADAFSSPDFDFGPIADSFLSKGVKNVVITLGARGAYFSNLKGGGFIVQATKVEKVVDTTAAGDTFCGAYAVEAVRKEKSVKDAVSWACKAAGRTVEVAGAQSAIPWANEV